MSNRSSDDNDGLESRIEQLEMYCQDVLQRDLKIAHSRECAAILETREMMQLLETLRALALVKRKEVELLTRRGKFSQCYVAAKVNAEKVVVKTCDEWWVELTQEEAITFCEHRLRTLSQKQQVLQQGTQSIQHTLGMILEGLAELRHARRSSQQPSQPQAPS
ncbi:MAG: hypothetical protein MHM6MM_000158 [Cercozoa sp. M6MM]